MSDSEQVDITKTSAPIPLYRGIMEQAQKHHVELERLLGNTPFYSAVEALLEIWRDLEMLYQGTDSIRPAQVLVTRGRQGFETCFFVIDSGLYGVALDCARDLMEVEYLLRHFRHNPNSIDLWLRGNDKVRKDKFSVNVLRQAEAKRRGKKPEQLTDSADYKGHSAELHLNPKPLLPRGFVDIGGDKHADSLIMILFEALRHGQKAAVEALRFASSVLPNVDQASYEQRFAKVFAMENGLKAALKHSGFPTEGI
jgi:hypothetical protein